MMPRPKKIDQPVRKMMSLSPKIAKAVSDYRFEHRIKTESEAIRRLIDAGLERLGFKPGRSRGRP